MRRGKKRGSVSSGCRYMLRIEINKHVASVVLDRPDIHNAFNDELAQRITEAFTDLGQRDEVRVIVLRANGKSFCAGADLNWMKRMVQYSYEENLRDARAVGRMFLAIAKCPKPVIARVHGAALGEAPVSSLHATLESPSSPFNSVSPKLSWASFRRSSLLS